MSGRDGRPGLAPGSWGTISTREVQPGSFQARTRIRDLDGRIRHVRRLGRSKAAANRALQEELRNRTTPTAGVMGHRTTLEELTTRWLDRCEERGKPSAGTLRAYRSATRTAMRNVGELRLAEVTPGVLTRGLEPMDSVPTQKRQALIVLRQAFSWAVREDVITASPMHEVEPVPRRPADPRALTDAEVERLRQLARDHRRLISETTGMPWPGPRPTLLLPDVVEVMLGTGLRIGEVLALTRKHVDLGTDPPIITVTGTLVGESGLHRQEWGKTAAATRRLAIPPAVVEVLARRLQEAGDGAKVFATGNGTWVAPNNVRRLWRSAVEGTELEEWATPHSLRRTVATRLERTHGLAAAAGQLGHTGGLVTEAHYIERQRVHDYRDGLDDGVVDDGG